MAERLESKGLRGQTSDSRLKQLNAAFGCMGFWEAKINKKKYLQAICKWYLKSMAQTQYTHFSRSHTSYVLTFLRSHVLISFETLR